jgi:SAM-dependent methyltransferase
MNKSEPGLRIDIGCGSAKKEGTIGVDIQSFPGVDHVIDIELNALPFGDRSVAYVHSSHFLEHAKNPTRIFAEISRVSADNARLELWTPYGWSNSAFVLDHRTFFNEDIYLHICVWFIDFWKEILNARWILNEFHYVVDPRTLCYLDAKQFSLDFALRHFQNIAKEFCAHITVTRDFTAESPQVKRTFSIGRFEPRYLLKSDKFAPRYDVMDAQSSDFPARDKLEKAIRSFTDGDPLPPL